MSAFRGNRTALARLAAQTLPQLGDAVRDVENEIAYRREHEWNAEEARAAALDDDKTIPPEQTLGAVQDLYQAILRVVAFTPPMLTADGDEAEALDDLWTDAVFSLIVTLHNPIIKWGIVGGFHPDVRDEIGAEVERTGREVWGVMRALTEEGDINVADFPPETKAVIEEIADAAPADESQLEGGK